MFVLMDIDDKVISSCVVVPLVQEKKKPLDEEAGTLLVGDDILDAFVGISQYD